MWEWAIVLVDNVLDKECIHIGIRQERSCLVPRLFVCSAMVRRWLDVSLEDKQEE